MSEVSSKGGSQSKVEVPDREKKQRIKESIKECEAVFDKGCVMQLGSAPIVPVESISTGCLTVDMALGCGGFPKSYMVEIFGPEGGGKTTLCLQAIAEAHRVGIPALYVDTENKLNLQYAAALGVNVKELLVCQPEYGEAAFQIIEIFVKNGAVGIVVLDSIAMLVPKSEYEGEIGDAGVGQLSRLVTQAVRKLKDQVRKSIVSMVFINQIRDKIGVTWGSTETTPAGHAIKHQCTVRMDIRRIAALKDGDKVVGARTKAKIVKNTFAAPFVDCEYDLRYGEGVSRETELVELGSERGVLKKDGSTYVYNGTKLGVGREKTRMFLKANPDVFKEVYGKVRAMMVIERQPKAE